MSRPKRITLGGYVYHVLNRANGRLKIFKKQGDFEAFEKIIAQGLERFSVRICGYCIMSNHWHMLLWPEEDEALSNFMRWITLTHTQRYHAAHGTTGIGHLYQGRFKSFPVEDEAYYLTVMRYIESNPVRAEIISGPEDWPWSSFAIREGYESPFPLSDGPVKLPMNWKQLVHDHLPEKELDHLTNSIKRGAPLGHPEWAKATALRMGLESTLRSRGRPKKGTGHL
ncbi:transposase [Planctomycetota bacterium]